MIRKLIGLLVLLGFWAPQGAYALGLGEMRLTSALNEPLKAEIQLKSAGDLSDSQIRVQLASIEDFEKAGVDRQFFLNNLRFSVRLGNNKGPDVIVVTTSQPVIEPYLDFVLELRWPTGRLLREYTALLDLPVFTDESPVAVAAPQKEKPASSGEVVEQRAKSEPESEVAEAAPAQKPDSESSPEKEKVATSESTAGPESKQAAASGSTATDLNEYGPTSRNDTLWGIATRVRADRSVSIQQTMLALQRLNPDAFSNSNINLLKTGKVLRVPTVQEIKDIAFQNAYEEVAAQNRQWRREDEPGNTELPQLDARPVEAQQAVAPEPEVEGHLVLAAVAAKTTEKQMESGAGGEEDSKEVSSVGGSNAADEDDGELAADLEHLEKIKRENEELDSRLEDMEQQLTTLQKLVTLKDEELAALQSSAVSRDGNDGTKQTEPVEAVTKTAATEASTTDKPKATDSNAKAQVSDLSLWDTILSNTLYLAIGAVVLVLLMLALLVSRRNAKRNDFEPAALDSEDSISSPDDVYLEGKRLIASSADESLDRRPTPFSSKPLPAGLDEEKEALRQQIHDQSNNVIGEADIFIAYGRHQQAIYLLLNAIEEQPGRLDYRLKLLEVYVDIKDRAGFNAQYEELLELNDFDAQQSVRQLLQAASLSYWLDDQDAPSVKIACKETGSRRSSDEPQVPLQEELAAEADEEVSAQNTDLATKPGLDDYDLTKLEQDLVAEELDLDTENDRLLENELDLGSELNLQDDEEAAATDKTLFSGEQSAPQRNATEFALELDESAFEELADQEDINDSLSLVPDFGNPGSRQISDDNFWGKTTAKRENTATIHDFPTELRSYKDTDVVDDDDLLKSDLELLGDADEVATKLDLARAYIDMGDTKGARDILEEVLQEGATKQKDEAIKLLSRIA